MPQELIKAIEFICCIGGILCVLAILSIATYPEMCRAWDRFGGRSKVILTPLVVSLCLYGGGKAIIGKIIFDYADYETRYIFNNGSFVTNDWVHIAYSKSVLLPDSANIFVDRVEVQYTNAEDIASHFLPTYSNTVGAAGLDFNIPFDYATNFNWHIYTDYVPGPASHTNGVALILWQTSKPGVATNVIVPTRTGIYIDALKVAPNLGGAE